MSSPKFPVVYFRPILPEDNFAMAALIRGCLAEFGALRPGFAGDDPELDDLADFYTHCRNAGYYVVDGEAELLGGGGVGPLKGGPPEVGELQKMYLASKARGCGIGQELLRFLMRRAKALGYQALYLESHSSMLAAHHLYTKHGFASLGHPLGETGHTSCDRWYLCRF